MPAHPLGQGGDEGEVLQPGCAVPAAGGGDPSDGDHSARPGALPPHQRRSCSPFPTRVPEERTHLHVVLLAGLCHLDGEVRDQDEAGGPRQDDVAILFGESCHRGAGRKREPVTTAGGHWSSGSSVQAETQVCVRKNC